MKVYAGIGSRETPEEICQLMRHVGRELGRRGWTLRSGGADGADAAFAAGASEAAAASGPLPEIFLPWSGFNGVEGGIVGSSLPSWPEAIALAQQVHPRPFLLTRNRGVLALMARNGLQVLGADLKSPSRFILCWAKGSTFDDTGRLMNVDGGTGQAIRIAYGRTSIPVFNLALPDHRARVERALSAPARAVPGSSPPRRLHARLIL